MQCPIPNTSNGYLCRYQGGAVITRLMSPSHPIITDRRVHIIRDNFHNFHFITDTGPCVAMYEWHGSSLLATRWPVCPGTDLWNLCDQGMSTSRMPWHESLKRAATIPVLYWLRWNSWIVGFRLECYVRWHEWPGMMEEYLWNVMYAKWHGVGHSDCIRHCYWHGNEAGPHIITIVRDILLELTSTHEHCCKRVVWRCKTYFWGHLKGEEIDQMIVSELRWKCYQVTKLRPPSDQSSIHHICC